MSVLPRRQIQQSRRQKSWGSQCWRWNEFRPRRQTLIKQKDGKMKTLESLHYEAQEKTDLWAGMTQQDLIERGKSREEANYLKEYFEGQRDAYAEAKRRFYSQVWVKPELDIEALRHKSYRSYYGYDIEVVTFVDVKKWLKGVLK
jgi:hypothetical protein